MDRQVGALAIAALLWVRSRALHLSNRRQLGRETPGVEGAAIRWITEATLILQERHRVSGWAMQAVAGNLAREPTLRE